MVTATSIVRPSRKCTHNGIMAFLLLCMQWLSSTAVAADALFVSVDRDKIYMNEMLELTVTGKQELSLSFGSLFNLSNLNLPEPDISSLLNDFNVIDRNQKYNVQSINGQNNATITWVYTLAPKHTGLITVPSLEFNQQHSASFQVEILDGKRAVSDQAPPLAFLEVAVDKQEVHLYEQVRYTLKLYYSDHLASGELSSPNPQNTLTEQLGDQKKYSSYRYNQRYDVIEREYVIFPQQAGDLTLDEQTFTGTMIDRRAGRKRMIREVSDRLSVKVLPAESGGFWLPAISFSLRENWDKELDTIQVGDNLTRTISMNALGLLASALPPLNQQEVEGFKIYPDQPVTESHPHEAGVEASRIEKQAYIAIKPGQWTLPEIRIPWYDTTNKVSRMAVIPSRTLTVIAGPAQGNPALPPATPVTKNSAPADKPLPKDLPAQTEESHNHMLFLSVITFMALGWGLTLYYVYSIKKQSGQVMPPAGPPSFDGQLSPLLHAIENRQPSWLNHLKSWAQVAVPDKHFDSILDVLRVLQDQDLKSLLLAFEQSFYSANRKPLDTDKLIEKLKQEHQLRSSKKVPAPSLESLYPLN
ncbi:MAG: protein BatD [Hahellaceae bacterium]|nr:protein BatD [Hahellaceae bacterium]